MSQTPDLDKTIASLQRMLEETKTEKGKLAITDRLIKCLGLKYKHSDVGKGGKFRSLPENGAAQHGERDRTSQ